MASLGLAYLDPSGSDPSSDGDGDVELVVLKLAVLKVIALEQGVDVVGDVDVEENARGEVPKKQDKQFIE
ncbi:hypothetical protein N7516_000720 [Penicillium verrucosum]|uniref:uncharacterized protein n=1 Tax=Penicillium verrucosum TaxID=60171 RepID=UPI00254581F0|nr:uncharacterized protein N7516_000720 [Penicillium verrucosum]KAJ5940552.1 hypothetical protein N7516_000720 [Penicillium verrucosum]